MRLRRLSCLALSIALVLPLVPIGQVLAADSTHAAKLERGFLSERPTDSDLHFLFKKSEHEKRKAQLAARRAARDAKRAERAAKVQLLRDARNFRNLRFPGKEVAKATRRLIETLTWHHDLEGAKAAATTEGKPILWIQALGELDGFL